MKKSATKRRKQSGKKKTVSPKRHNEWTKGNSGFSIKNILQGNKTWRETELTGMMLNKEAKYKVKRMFPGGLSKIVNMFLEEVAKGRPVIIFDMPFLRPDGMQRPFPVPHQILQVNRITRKITGRFNTVFEAHQATGFPSGSISRSLEGKTKNVKGFYFIYSDEYDRGKSNNGFNYTTNRRPD